ncbi:MAG: fatty acid desaturase, partial [Paracoccaceae bacterium]
WGAGTTVIWEFSPILALVITTLTVAQFSSLQHEVLHGHPFANIRLNEALVFPGITVFIPYGRFRDLHLAHHYDPDLTDPYEDPESNFMDPVVWAKTPGWARILYQVNNTLAGRVLIGPAVSMWGFTRSEITAIRAGDKAAARAWVEHAFGLGLVLAWLLAVASMPIWAYLICAYVGFGLLKIRTFLEHRAHEASRARSVVIEDRGLFALLFLNNNYHAVHHSHPEVAWYDLPAKYAANRDHYLRRNEGYVYRNYAQIFRQYAFRQKDPVPHPLWEAADQEIRRNVGVAPELSKNGTPG